MCQKMRVHNSHYYSWTRHLSFVVWTWIQCQKRE